MNNSPAICIVTFCDYTRLDNLACICIMLLSVEVVAEFSVCRTLISGTFSFTFNAIQLWFDFFFAKLLLVLLALVCDPL